MVCLGLKPRAAGWKAQMNPLSYGGTPRISCLLTSFSGSNDKYGIKFDQTSLNGKSVIGVHGIQTLATGCKYQTNPLSYDSPLSNWIMTSWGSGCSTVGRVVTSNTTIPRFKSSHHKFVSIAYLLWTAVWKDENNGKKKQWCRWIHWIHCFDVT